MKKLTGIMLYLALFLAFSQTPAGEIYTWVDADGIVHYSATPPDDATSEVAQIELPPPPPPRPASAEDFYSVINQAARMRARRLESEALMAQRRAADAAARQARAEEQVALELARQSSIQDQPRYYPLYLHNPRIGHRPYWKHRPGHHDRHYRDTGRGSYFRSRRNDPVW